VEKRIKIGQQYFKVVSDDNYLDAMGCVYEPHMVELYETLIGPDDTVLDVGANIGLTAILFSRIAKKVVCFEPSPSTFDYLQRNLQKAQADNVRLFNIGLGRRKEETTITFSKNNRSGGFVSDMFNIEQDHVTERIIIDTLDNVLAANNIAKVDFIKIDVEGFEYEVIQGATNTLKSSNPVIVLEMNHFCLNVFRRINIQDFIYSLRAVFPYLWAIDTDNSSIMDLHNQTETYAVMHEHIGHNRYPNLVAGFDSEIGARLNGMMNRFHHATNVHMPQEAVPIVRDAKGRIDVTRVPESAFVGETFEVDACVFNESSYDWITIPGDKPIRLSYHWRNAQGAMVVFDGVRTEIESDKVAAGDKVAVTMRVTAPAEAGEYWLDLTIVQDGVCWFEDRGFEINTKKIVVNNADG